MNPQSVYPFQIAALTALAGTGGPLHGTQLILFQNNLTLTKTTTLADLTAATFVGYAAVAGITFGTPYIDQFGVVRIDAPSVDFIMTSNSTPNTIYGWALLDTAGTDLEVAAMLASPIPLTIAGQGLNVQPTFAYGG